jgi:hypothetical protein
VRIKFTLIIGVLFTIFFATVTKSPADANAIKQQDSPTIHKFISNNIQQMPGAENFYIFKEKFFSDSVFQISRIKFPVQIFDLDRENFWLIVLNEPVDTLKLLIKNQWNFHSSLASDTANFEVKIKFNDNTMTYVERGKDFGIATLYKFILIKGKWFLSRVEYINL